VLESDVKGDTRGILKEQRCKTGEYEEESEYRNTYDPTHLLRVLKERREHSLSSMEE
jgi:hypothetical protein